MFRPSAALLALTLATPAFAADPIDGAALYRTYCETCHGATGKGDGVAGMYLSPTPANFTTADFWKTRDAAAVRRAVTEGGAAIGKSPLMTAWKGVLTAEQIEAVARVVEGWKPQAP